VAPITQQRATVPEWHRCERYWRKGFQCAFHGRRPRRKQQDDGEDRDHDEEFKFTKPSVAPPRVGAGVPALKKGPSPAVSAAAEAVPVVAYRKSSPHAFKAKAEVGIQIPSSIPLEEAYGQPLRAPEKIEDQVPPPAKGRIDIGGASEEQFVTFLDAQPGKVAAAKVNQKGQVEEGGMNAFEAYALAFSAIFTLTAVSHLWQTYNARIRRSGGGVKRTPPGKQIPPRTKTPFTRKGKPPVKVPAKVPAKVPVGAGSFISNVTGRGAGGFIFQQTIGSTEPPLPQETFDKEALTSISESVPPYLASWQEEAFGPGQ